MSKSPLKNIGSLFKPNKKPEKAIERELDTSVRRSAVLEQSLATETLNSVLNNLENGIPLNITLKEHNIKARVWFQWMKRDPSLALAVENAREIFREKTQQKVYELGFTGYDEPLFYMNQQVGTRKKYIPAYGKAWLEANIPAYKKTVQVAGTIGHEHIHQTVNYDRKELARDLKTLPAAELAAKYKSELIVEYKNILSGNLLPEPEEEIENAVIMENENIQL